MQLRNRVVPHTVVVRKKYTYRKNKENAPSPDQAPPPPPAPHETMEAKAIGQTGILAQLMDDLAWTAECVDVLMNEDDNNEQRIKTQETSLFQMRAELKECAETIERLSSENKTLSGRLETADASLVHMRTELKDSLQTMSKYMDMVRVCADGALADICYLTAYNMYQCIGIDARRFHENKQFNEDAKTAFLLSTINKKKIMAHPDKHLQNTKQASDVFDHLNYLQSVLGDTEKRTRYNLLLAQFWVHERTGNRYVRTYIPHGGVYNTDRTIMNQYLDQRINIYIPTPSYLRSREQLPAYEPGIYIDIESPFM